MTTPTGEQYPEYVAARSAAFEKFHKQHAATIEALCDELDEIASGGDFKDGGVLQGDASPAAFTAFYRAAKAFVTIDESTERKPWDQ